jgi:Ser/Thr protein kinase RdoA (MazF antagonist)
VLAAFGAAGVRVVPFGGGQATSWHAGDLVLKPADLDRAELEWQAQVSSQISCDGFRLAQPRTAADGSLCVDGWCATEYLPGQHYQRRWPEIIAVGERFHAALRGIPRPGFLDHRASPWATSDRVAWGEIPPDDFASYVRQSGVPTGPVMGVA